MLQNAANGFRPHTGDHYVRDAGIRHLLQAIRQKDADPVRQPPPGCCLSGILQRALADIRSDHTGADALLQQVDRQISVIRAHITAASGTGHQPSACQQPRG